MIGILNTVISVAAKLPLFKKGAGKITPASIIVGGVSAITGAVSPHILTDQNLVPTIQALASVITALATLVGAFGFGRRTVRESSETD